ncbi:MAG: diguanylate cyclase [Sulfurimonas sp.]|nr:MAG: diguanylate cyclase [Sulfurimonas sp.]
MNYIINNKFLKIIPLIFLLLIVIKIIHSYIDIKEKEDEFAKKEAEVLTSYVISSRQYHQKLFLDGTIELNKRTIKSLPAYSSKIISDTFSKNNTLNITLRTVSDKAKNINSAADKDELLAINYFNKNLNEQTYFSNHNSDFYQYASVLKIKQTCLTCHGKKENSPLYIQNNYENAYDYKLSEVRGIISIKIPKKDLDKYFFHTFFTSITYDAIYLLFIVIVSQYLLFKSKKINLILKSKIKDKATALKNSFFLNNLTGLPNRLKLIEHINMKSKNNIHLAIINIDRFKDINDLYGFNEGDKLLKQIALSIYKLCDKKNSLYKLPNDEYAILKSDEISLEKFFKTVKYVINQLQETMFDIHNHSVFITFSCGIATSKESLLSKANSALSIAKKNKKNIVIYDNTFDEKERISQNIAGVLMIKNAISNDSINPYFQAIYNTKTKEIEKYECLARIILDNGEVLTPASFLDISIKSKLYHEITKAIIKKSFTYFKDKHYEFSINISIHDIQDKKTLKFIIDSIMNYENSEKIVFEILESDKIGNYEELKEFIKIVKQYGCKIAIDDFGSGYSNFSHILSLNVDYLKIDASLVRYVTTNLNSRIITQTIIDFSSKLGLKTIAEFVEDKHSLELLEKMGIDFVQGYYIGKPKKSLD